MSKLYIIFLLLIANNIQAQKIDSIPVNLGISSSKPEFYLNNKLTEINDSRKKLKALIIPGAMIAYGVISLESDALQELDYKFKEEIWTENQHNTIKIDNYLQYAPAVSVYALNALGIKGKNNFRDRTLIYLTASTMMGITVESLKTVTKSQRPDGGTNAFPSGHTASAFVAAEFLRQEYKSISPWIGVAGYAMATMTAYLRMYNNKHWFSDLLPAAGIGILSTRAAYWIYPAIKRKLFRNKPMNTIVMPYYHKGNAGVSLTYNFHKD